MMRFIFGMSAVGMALGLLSFTTLPVAGQVTNTASPSELPRMPDGHPDLQGTYDLATMTPLERWPGDPPLLTKEQAEALQKAEAERRAKTAGGDEPLPLDRPRRRWAAKSAHRNRTLNFWRTSEAAPLAAIIVSGSTRARHTRRLPDRFEHPS